MPTVCSPKRIGTAFITTRRPGDVVSGLLSTIGGAIAQCPGFFKKPGPKLSLFVPTVAIHHVGAWRLLAAREVGHSIKRLVLFFRNNVAHYDVDSSEPRYKRSGIVWRHLLRGFEPEIRDGSVCFATDSERLAHE